VSLPVPVPAVRAVAVVRSSTDQDVVTLVGLDGGVLGTLTLPGTSAPATPLAVGPDGVTAATGGRLREVTVSRGVVDLGPVPAPAPAMTFVMSPDGRSLAWAVQTPAPGAVAGAPAFHNQLWVSAAGGTPRLLADRPGTLASPAPDAPRMWFYQLLGWTSRGILVGRLPVGIGGVGPFIDEGYRAHTALVDPATGATTALTDDSACPLSSLAPDGTVACFRRGPSGAATAVVLRQPGGGVLAWPLSGTSAAGMGRLDPARGRLAYATVPVASDPAAWPSRTVLHVLDTRTGTAAGVGPVGLQPLAWTPDGRIVAERWQQQAAGQPLRLSIDVVDAAGGSLRTLTAPAPSAGVLGVVVGG
jgi:hypothetical protein